MSERIERIVALVATTEGFKSKVVHVSCYRRGILLVSTKERIYGVTSSNVYDSLKHQNFYIILKFNLESLKHD